MKYIFVVGAPGSRWSGVAKSIYYSDQIDQTDDTPERTYYNPKSPAKAKQLMHRGAYFDPGMEFGNELENFDSLSKEDLEKRKELKKDYLNKEEIYKFEIYQLQKQVQNLYIRIKELNEQIYELTNKK